MARFSFLTLQQISQSEGLKQLIPPQYGDSALNLILQGQRELQSGALRGHEISRSESQSLQIKLYFSTAGGVREFFLLEGSSNGPLSIDSQDDELTALHGSCLVLMWWALMGDVSFLRHLDSHVRGFCKDLQDFISGKQVNVGANDAPARLDKVTLASVSLVFHEKTLAQGESLESFLPELENPWRLSEGNPLEDPRNPSAFHLPTVFKKATQATNTMYWSDAKRQYQVASTVRFNFSDGVQVSTADLLRHSHKVHVPRDLWPQPVAVKSVEARWPLLQSDKHIFVSRELEEIEEIMQELLAKIAKRLQQKTLKVFLQAEFQSHRALEIHSLFFDAATEFDWSVKFVESPEWQGLFSLKSKTPELNYTFFESFALSPQTGVLVVHPWWHEQKNLRELVARQTKEKADLFLPEFRIARASVVQKVLQHLRRKQIAVSIEGGSHHLLADSSGLRLSVLDDAHYLVHRVFILPEKTIARRAFSPVMTKLLHSLNESVASFLDVEVRDYVAAAGVKRDWDLKLIRHTGVLLYVTFETLMYHFQGRLLEDVECESDDVLPALYAKIHSLLVIGDGTLLERKTPLQDLVSRSTLSVFEEYIRRLQKMLGEAESLYLESGEYFFEGSVERECRWLYEVLKHMAFSTAGTIFKRSRTGLLAKIYAGDPEKDLDLLEGKFLMPAPIKGSMSVSSTIALLQPLIAHRTQLFLNDQGLVELGESDFKVDFEVKTQVERGDINWFDLNPRFFLQGLEVNPESFKSFGGGGGVLEYNGKYYLVPQAQIPNLKRLENFWLALQKGQDRTGKKGWVEKFYQFGKNKTLELLALRASGVGIRGDEEWNKLCEFYDSLGADRAQIQMPVTVRAELKPYQLTGTQWLHDLYRLRLGALLADDMGLGKTLQALAFLEHLRLDKKLGAVLVIVPSSLVYNWQSEVEKFTPELPFEIFTSKDQDRIGRRLEAKEDLVLVTTYGLLMENDKFLAQYNWNVLIFDEAQNLKNITTRRTSSARMLNARFKVCLTGTPMENHYGEYYSLVDLVVPGSLGSYEDFRRVYVNSETIQPEEIADLKLRTKPLIMRRTKREILDQLPEKQETKVSIAFEEDQKQIYRDIAIAYNQKIQDSLKTQAESQVQLQMLTALLRLRQACSDPAGLPEVEYKKTPPKLEALVESLQEIVEAGESALVFTQFLQTLGHTEKLLKELNIPVFVLHGAVTTKQRQEVLRQFNETKGGAVLVMTLKTGGVGLNLTKASYVFHLEPWWNPAVENQATDRAHRLGQTKSVQVFRYIMHESLEEKMEVLKARKNIKFSSLFSDTETLSLEAREASQSLSRDDFEFLLS